MSATHADGLGPSRPLEIGASARHRMLASTLGVLDLAAALVIAGLGALLAAGRLEGLSLESLAGQSISFTQGGVVLGLLLLWRGSLAGAGLYDARTPLLGRERRRALLVAATLNTTFLVSAAPLLGFSEPAALASLGVSFWAGSLLATAGVRAALSLARRVVSERDPRHVVVVGTNPLAVWYARKLEDDPDQAAHLMGFVDEDWSGISEFRDEGGALVSDLKNFDSFVRQNQLDEVVIAAPLSALEVPGSAVLQICREHGIPTRFLVHTLSDLTVEGTRTAGADGASLATARNGAIEGWSALVKRGIDIVVASSLLLVLSPVFLVVAALVATTSRGPVFFGQDRVGLNKRRFKMHKFRTMVTGAEEQLPELRHLNEAGGPVFKLRNDPRITPVGRIARTWSLDELPQLLNVLKGDMSLVGPRPLPFTDFAGFEEDRHRRRLSVRPGITGLWQVSGRSGIPFEEWMELDLEYIDRWSLWLDFQILARTLPAVLRREGAE